MTEHDTSRWARARRKGAANWRARKQHQVEVEHDGLPLREVLEGYRRDGVPWKVIAGICEVSDKTLLAWRRALGMPVPDAPVPPDFEARRERSERLAAQIAMLRHTHTVAQVADILGIHPSTVTALTPAEDKGRYVQTPEGRARKAASARRRWAAWRGPAQGRFHPWYAPLKQRRCA